MKCASTFLRAKVSKVYTGEEGLGPGSTSQSEDEALLNEIKQKAGDFDRLIDLIKDKLQNVTRREKIQLLTLVPLNWPKKKVCETFQVTDYAVRQSRKLLQDKGIFSLPNIRKGNKLDNETVNIIVD